MEMKIAAAKAIANLIPEEELSVNKIIPASLDTRVPVVVARAVAEEAINSKVSRIDIDAQHVEENIRHFIVERNLRVFTHKL